MSQPGAPSAQRPLYETEIEVRWSDMDALGHVNNATYLTYFETARVEWLRARLQDNALRADEGSGPVVVNAFVEFLRPVVYPDRVKVRVYAATPGRSSVDTRYEMVTGSQPDSLAATGSARIVWVDRRTGRSTPLPEQIRAWIAPDADP